MGKVKAIPDGYSAVTPHLTVRGAAQAIEFYLATRQEPGLAGPTGWNEYVIGSDSIDSFLGNAELADSVNHLLVVGFYLINIGYVSLALKYGDKPSDLATAIESLSTKVGMVLIVLGVMHFFNLYVFSKMRKRALLHSAPPPIPPQGYTPVVE